MAEEPFANIKIPRGTPTWAIGIVAILLGVATIGYVFRPEVNLFVDGSRQVALKRAESDTATLASVLSLAERNSSQIADISKALGQAQERVTALSDRVLVLEQELTRSEKSRLECEEKLLKCKG